MNFRNRIQGNRAEDTRQTEHILSFEEGTVRTTVYFSSYGILTFLQIGSDIEISGIAWILGEAHILTVNPQIEEGIDTIETDKGLTSVPVLRNFEITAEGTHFIPVLISGPVGRRGTHHTPTPVVHFHAMLKDHRLVDVNRGSILLASVFLNAINVPARRYGNHIPWSYIIIRLIEIFRAGVRIGCPVKLPVTIEWLPELTVLR